MRVASKVRNLLSKIGHARRLSSRIIRYVRDGRTDRQKQRLVPPSLSFDVRGTACRRLSGMHRR